MDELKDIVETTGEDIESAISEGLKQLGLDRDEVRIEIVDEGSPGFLGLGKREAHVRLTPFSSVEEPTSTDTVGDEKIKQEDYAVSPDTDEFSGEVVRAEPNEADVAVQIVEKLLFKIGVSASTKKRQTEPDDLTGERKWVIDVRGDDLGPLIGPKGDTLNSLQYIARLMTGHVVRQRPTFIIDIEGYRARREQALARLAKRMAKKAVNRGKPLSLEPMPPNERRIIHITLRDDDEVYTESFGEGKRRKVKIFPKT